MRASKFIKLQSDLFDSTKKNIKPLMVFEMANNHMGDVKHGLKIIRTFCSVAKPFSTSFTFAFKFQLRDIDTYIHPSYKTRMDISYVKRFTETQLTQNDIRRLKEEVDKTGFVSICTPFDERSVDHIEKINFNCLKVASASMMDWPLLERMVTVDKPCIISTAGSAWKDIDRVVSFFKHRNRTIALLHCVGEYPTPDGHLELNQIDEFRGRYPDTVIGFSTHEHPTSTVPVQMAIAKGARIIEKHVGLPTPKYPLNAYSVGPDDMKRFLNAAQTALNMCGVVANRASASKKELSDLRQFSRGVFTTTPISKGQQISEKDISLAFPNVEGQLLASNISKYDSHTAKHAIAANSPIFSKDIQSVHTREKIIAIAQKVKALLIKSTIPFPSRVELEISHHYGINSFYKYGATIVNVVNREYCKKLIIVLPKQTHPTQYHKKKEETFHIMYGEFVVILNGKKRVSRVGDIVTVERGVKHSFSSPTGGILEEISSTHYTNDSFYVDEKINANKLRKTYLSYWG